MRRQTLKAARVRCVLPPNRVIPVQKERSRHTHKIALRKWNPEGD